MTPTDLGLSAGLVAVYHILYMTPTDLGLSAGPEVVYEILYDTDIFSLTLAGRLAQL